MRNILLLWFIGLIFSACQSFDEKKSILPPKKFGEVYWDVQIASTFATEYIRMDSLKNDSIELDEMKRVIYSKYGISEELYIKSLDYYNDHPNEMIAIIDSLEVRKKKQQKARDRLLRPE